MALLLCCAACCCSATAVAVARNLLAASLRWRAEQKRSIGGRVQRFLARDDTPSATLWRLKLLQTESHRPLMSGVKRMHGRGKME